MQHTIAGLVGKWEFDGASRRFGSAILPYGVARKVIMAVRYNAVTGKGEQRDVTPAHVKALAREIEEGTYTPTPVSAGCRRGQAKSLRIDSGMFELEVDEDNPLAQTDGGHRYEAIEEIRRRLTDRLSKAHKAKQDDTAAHLEARLKELDNLDIAVTIHFDGEPQLDFINLQKGRPADRSHILSLSVQKRAETDPAVKLAVDVAKFLDKAEKSPFYQTVRLDSRDCGELPISTLASKGASDLATSLVGLARVGLASDKDPGKLAQWLGHTVVAAFRAIEEHAPDLVAKGHVLTPIKFSGKKGQSTMLTGLGLCLAYRMLVLGHELPRRREDLSRLVDCAKWSLDLEIIGSFSGPQKRKLLHAFAVEFFQDLEVPKHEGIPVQLIQVLSSSGLGVSKLTKELKLGRGGTPHIDVLVEREEEAMEEAVEETLVTDDELAPWEVPA